MFQAGCRENNSVNIVNNNQIEAHAHLDQKSKGEDEYKTINVNDDLLIKYIVPRTHNW